VTPTDFMLLVGGIILVGFLADELFRKKYIPDSVILMALGVILGHLVFYKANLLDFAGFMASIAVAIILYDTGLNLDLVDTLKESGPAFLLATVSYFLSAGLITLAAYSLLGWSIVKSLLLGTMLGGTSAAVVATIASKLPISPKTKIILNVESTVTNAYALVFVITLLNFIQTGSINPLDALHIMAASLSIAVVFGLIAGILWLKVLSKINNHPYAQMLTLGIMFLIYAAVEYLKGIGAIASFVFGLVLGNARTVKNMFFLEGDYRLSRRFKAFNDEISFFIRVFFFVFLGTIFVPPKGINLYLFSLLLLVLAILARYVAAKLSQVEDVAIATVSIPRGLSEAVVASLLISMGFPGAETYLQIASLVIFFTNVATALLLFVILHTMGKKLEG